MILKVALRVVFPFALSISALGQTLEARAQVAVVAPAARELIDAALGRFAARDGATALSDQVAKLGGKTAIDDFSTRIAQEGGDAEGERPAQDQVGAPDPCPCRDHPRQRALGERPGGFDPQEDQGEEDEDAPRGPGCLKWLHQVQCGSMRSQNPTAQLSPVPAKSLHA